MDPIGFWQGVLSSPLTTRGHGRGSGLVTIHDMRIPGDGIWPQALGVLRVGVAVKRGTPNKPAQAWGPKGEGTAWDPVVDAVPQDCSPRAADISARRRTIC